MKLLLRILAAIVLGELTMEALGRICTVLQVKALNSWSLAHGYFLVVWPALTVAIYLLLGLLPMLKKKEPNQPLEPTR